MLVVLTVWDLGLSACQPQAPACPEASESERFLSGAELERSLKATPIPFSTPIAVKLGNLEVVAQKVVAGPLCNDTWRGTVYVSCDVRVPEWYDTPTFLKDCRLEVEPGTVVYVAAHNNTAYYNGCSCHTGETSNP